MSLPYARAVTSFNFRRPPVIEVAIGIEFVTPAPLAVQAVLDVREQLREAFPKVELQPPLPPPPPLGVSGTFMGLQFGGPVQRWWFVSEDDSRLIQLQEDRLLFNWRRKTADSVYPRFHSLLPEFLDLAGRVGAAAGGLQILSLQTDYYNADESLSPGSGLSELLTACRPTRGDLEMRVTRSAQIGAHEAEAALGARRNDDGPALFSVTARSEAGGMSGQDEQALTDALGALHDLALQLFDEEICPAAKRRWGA